MKAHKYALIGKDVRYSLSQKIHAYFGNDSYSLLSVNEMELKNLLSLKEFIGLNVTYPYKKFVMNFLDEIDENARKIGSVNTIVNIDGILKGYNTDYDGLKYLLRTHSISLKNKNVGILGDGGSSKTIAHIAMEQGANLISIANRNLEKHNGAIAFEELEKQEIHVLFNATPNGMVPHADDPLLIDIHKFKNLEAVIDLIYLPLKSRLLVEAEKINVKSISGLDMLIEQARVAEEIFNKSFINEDHSKQIIDKIRKENLNIVLIGMPYSGKRTLAFQIAKNLNKTFVDLDSTIEEKMGCSISEIFTKYGEAYFRKLECDLIKELSSQTNLIIATGGGVILSEENMDLLKLNGVICLVRRDKKLIKFDNTRPLVKNETEYDELWKKRETLYLRHAQIIVHNDDLKKTAKEIEEKAYEIFSN